MYENIKFKYDSAAYYDGLFYYLDFDYNALVIKNVSGKVVQTYPITINLPSPQLKLIYNGVYFFSLHKEYNAIFIRKWCIDNYSLKLIKEYDYSTVGLLTDSTVIYRKFFNTSITYGGWYVGGSSGSSFSLYNADLTLGDCPDSPWAGPTLTKDFVPIEDFVFESKFKIVNNTETTYKTRIYYDLAESGAEVKYSFILEYNYLWLYVDNVLVWESSISLNVDGYNIIKVIKSDGYLNVTINGVSIYKDVVSSYSVSKTILRFLNLSSLGRDFVYVTYLKLTGYKVKDLVDTETLNLDTYYTYLKAPALAGSSSITLFGETQYIEEGTVLSFGNSTTFEEVTVTGVLSDNTYGLSYYLEYDHEENEEVIYSRNFYFFNEYTGTLPERSLYKLDYVTGYKVGSYSYIINESVKASTIFTHHNYNLLGFVHNTNFILLDMDNDLVLYDTMNLDNIEEDDATIIPIYDCFFHRGSLYRIQKKATYFGTTYVWGTYNYQLSPIDSFVDSVAVQAFPVIVNSDGISKVKVSANVKDQYASPSVSVKVLFKEDDDGGYMLLMDRYTDINGYTYNYYRSGVIPRTVLLEIEAIQEDW